MRAICRCPRVLVIGAWLALATAGCAAPGGDPEPAATAAREQLVEVNGTELFVVRMGAGEPIIVVHGGPVLEHGYLLPHLAPLADTRELILFDQRLSGRSAGEVGPESVRLATFVDDIEALRQALGLGRVHLTGHSWGGLLAMRYAIAHGDRLRSLVLLDSMAASSEAWQAEQQAVAGRMTESFQQEVQALRESEGFAAREPAAIAAMLRLQFGLQFSNPDHLDRLALYVPDDYARRSEQFGAMMVDLQLFDLTDDLTAVDVPALVLYGADEPGAALGGEAIAAALPDSRFVLIEGAGHFPFIERPEAFLAAVREFLDNLQIP